MKGIVWDGKELTLHEDLEVRDPGPGEVRVRIARSGVPAWDRSAFRAVNAMPDAIAPVA